MVLIINLLLLGVMAGFLAGLFGIGGSMVMVPFLVPLFDSLNLFGASSIKFAIPTAMAVVCFTALSSMRAHHKKGAINWRLTAIFTIGILPGGLLASWGLFTFLQASWLYFLFASLAIFSAWQMWYGYSYKKSGNNGKKIKAKKFNQKKIFDILPAKPILIIFGAAVGCLSGLVGAGGGFLMVPFQTYFGVPANRAIANSASTGFPIAVVNSIGFLLADNSGLGGMQTIGFIHWPSVFIIAMASVLLAPLGANIAHRLPLPTLRRIFSIFLFVMASYMIWRGYQIF